MSVIHVRPQFRATGPRPASRPPGANTSITGPVDTVLLGTAGLDPKLMDPAKMRQLVAARPLEPADGTPKIGAAEYYQFRHKDFLKRNPGQEAPDYYLQYGKKYFERFHAQKGNLSKCGQKFVDRVGVSLQRRIEALRKKDPVKFAELERDNEAFRKFAYATHPGAYVTSGLSRTTLADRIKIGLTPDRKDLLTRDGLSQMVETGAATAILDYIEFLHPQVGDKLIPPCRD